MAGATHFDHEGGPSTGSAFVHNQDELLSGRGWLSQPGPMDADLVAHIAALARRQDGLFSRAQALKVGLRGRDLDRWLRQGHVREHQPQVYGAATAPASLGQAERAALLAAGEQALLSHDNAAARWLFDVPAPSGVWLTLPYRSRPPRLDGVDIMRSRHLEGVRRVKDGVALTAPARTWVDLGRTLSDQELEAALARGLQRGSFTLQGVDRVMAVAHNRAGTGSVRAVLRHYQPEWESVLGAAFADLMSRAGIELVAGRVVEHNGRRVAVLDFADEVARLAFGVDGWRYHGSKTQQQRDRARDRMLLALGWVTVRFTTQDILLRPEHVVAEVRALLLSRAA